MEQSGGIYVFPAECSAAFAAVNVANGVVASGHWAIIGFTFDDIDTGELDK